MSIHPRDIDGASIAVFIWDHTHRCGGSSVLFGTSRFFDGEFFVERSRVPFRMPIPESAWDNLRINPDPGEGKTFEHADYVVMLRLGPMPDEDPVESYRRIEMPEFKDQNDF